MTTEAQDQQALDAMLAEVDDFDDVDAAYREVRPKPYGFLFAGQKWVLPHMRSLGYKTRDELEQVESMTLTQVRELLARMFGPAQAQRWDALDVGDDVTEVFFRRWLAHSGAKLGEAQASSGSSESTGGNSNPTSAATTGSASRRRSTAKKATAASRRGKSLP